jgi:NCS1 family nucleobase:cation symporter-1
MITGFLGLAMQPWKLMATPDAYIFGWLEGYAGLMGPIAGIMICDYFFIRKTKLSIHSLYHREGIYHYSQGLQSSRHCVVSVVKDRMFRWLCRSVNGLGLQ